VPGGANHSALVGALGKRVRRQRGGQFSQRGIALLAAAMAIAVTAAITVEFSTNTNVDWIEATNTRDDMRAHFLARSAMNLSELIIRVQTDVMDRNRQYLGDIQLADFVPMFIGAFGGSKDEVDSFAQMLGAGGSDLKGLGVSIGSFNVEVDTDDDKINLNCANGGTETVKTLQTKLQALFYFDIYNPIFQNADADGWRRDRAQQVAALIDYVDTNRSKFNAVGAAEDYGYQTLNDKYLAKNNYLDTVGEIKLVRGVDDRLWALFGDQFTVYGDCKENLAAVEDPKLIAPIILLAAKDAEDPVLRDPLKLWMLAQRVGEARSWGIYFDTLQSFADFVKDPDGALGDLMASSGLSQSSSTSSTALPPVEGVELDMQKLQQIARAGTRRTYRVTATANIDTLDKTIVGVWDTQVQNQNPRGPGYERGAWVFWREE